MLKIFKCKEDVYQQLIDGLNSIFVSPFDRKGIFSLSRSISSCYYDYSCLDFLQ